MNKEDNLNTISLYAIFPICFKSFSSSCGIFLGSNIPPSGAYPENNPSSKLHSKEERTLLKRMVGKGNGKKKKKKRKIQKIKCKKIKMPDILFIWWVITRVL